MAKKKQKATSALRALKANGIEPELLPYDYVDKGGTAVAAAELGKDEHQVIKTLVFEDEQKEPLVVLMHGDRMVSTKGLARELGKKSIVPCTPEIARKHTGYTVGGTSPFGMLKPLPVYVEASVLDLDEIHINAGKRGLLMTIRTADLVRILSPTPVTVAIDH